MQKRVPELKQYFMYLFPSFSRPEILDDDFFNSLWFLTLDFPLNTVKDPRSMHYVLLHMYLHYVELEQSGCSSSKKNEAKEVAEWLIPFI